MLILPIEEAKPLMVLAAPVQHPDQPGHSLLNGGFILDEKFIARLKEMRVGQILIDYPGLEDLDRHLGPLLSPARQAVYSQVRESIEAAQSRTRADVSYSQYYATTRELITTLMWQGDSAIFMDQMSGMGGDAVAHATSVAHLSLLLGIKLEEYLIRERKRLPVHHAKEVVNLGVAGMLHDIGKAKLAEELQQYTGPNAPLDDAQLKAWEEHPQIGYDLIRSGIEPSAAAAVLHHHQRFGGGGFPRPIDDPSPEGGRKGRQIHVFTRIISAANLYDRLATVARGPRRSNLEVLHLMRTTYASWIDPVVLKALQTLAPPFMPGAMVSLSDSSRAVVVEVDAATPYNPTVRRMQSDQTLAEERIHAGVEGAPAIATLNGTPVAPFLPEEVAHTVQR